ncbi:response regulator [Fodinibius halophilus]|uniref:Response regulator n=1 Tax=Fodinibius halophilus TaxID=1736908 RepID=A0A6M1T2F9_9BACT|nr:response regulator [Fodinibius halophilus]NGP87415.1 response regulator [Fodinibius halophilus]
MSTQILIVDDSAMMRKVIEKTINICDIDDVHIYEAGNGKEGLDMMKEHPVDLLIMDISMPVMDGMEMLKVVRKNESIEALPILIVSNESNKRRIEELISQGTVFVHKPFTPEELGDNILEVIREKLA